MKVAMTLPSFSTDPDDVVLVAHAAEAAGLDGLFLFDHLFRDAPVPGAEPRPALDVVAMLGAVAAETERITLGPLVARATLRPPATLAASLATVRRIAGERLVVGLGAGDSASRAENETFGLDFGSEEDRLDALDAAVRTVRADGTPVWVGGTSFGVRMLAAGRADGWNRWGGNPELFARQARTVTELRDPGSGPFTLSRGGIVLLGTNEVDADERRSHLDPGPHVLVGGPERVAEGLREYAFGGAEWVIAGFLDAANPENAAMLGERVVPLLRDGAGYLRR